MIPALLGSLVRWLVTLGGAQAWLTEDDMTQALGLFASVASLLWSFWQKKVAYEREQR
jgi:hypothetical protein